MASMDNFFISEMQSAIERAFQFFDYLNEEERIDMINWIKLKMKPHNPIQEPVDCVLWVKAEEVVPNSYNPNKVAPPEMRLLHLSVKADGFTQPIVAIHDPEKKRNIIVDGFHRDKTGRLKDISSRTKGRLPITLIDKPVEELMASTIRHNRARGKHQISPMSAIVAYLYKKGWKDERIAKELGMDLDEVLRLKQITGLPELFAGSGYSKAWE